LSGQHDAAGVCHPAAQEGKRDYLKFLIQEARTVFEHQVDFKSLDGGARFRLHFDMKTRDFRAEGKP
jgi:hypothetical protein